MGLLQAVMLRHSCYHALSPVPGYQLVSNTALRTTHSDAQQGTWRFTTKLCCVEHMHLPQALAHFLQQKHRRSRELQPRHHHKKQFQVLDPQC